MSGQSAMDASCGSDGLSACNSVEDVLNNGFAVTFVRSSATVIAGAKPAAVFSFCPKGVLGAAGGYMPWVTTRVLCVRSCARFFAPTRASFPGTAFVLRLWGQGPDVCSCSFGGESSSLASLRIPIAVTFSGGWAMAWMQGS